jgi:hypothetical protein
MGASQPKQTQPPIFNVEVKVNINKNDCNQGIDGGAPAPVSPIDIKTEIRGENGENLPHNLKINQNVINDIINSTLSQTKPSETEEITIKKKKKDNNTKYQNNKENEKDNTYSIFNSSNAIDITNGYIPDINNKNDYNENNNINNNEIKDINNNFNENIINNNKNENQENNYNFMKEGVKNVTKFGDEEEEEKENNKPPTPIGEVDMNIGLFKNNKNNEEEKKETDKGFDHDMNQGHIKNEENGDKVDYYLDINYSSNDLELSQSAYILQGNNYLEQAKNMINKGYIPLFLKIDNNAPMFLAIKETSPLKSLLLTYLKMCPRTDEGLLNEIKLYHKKRLLNSDEEIINLNLEPMDIITNYMTD